MKPILTLKNVTKQYPGVTAFDHMNLEIYPGEVHALMGENGAGKSTLIKVISGAIKPNGGSIVYEDVTYDSMTPALSKNWESVSFTRNLIWCRICLWQRIFFWGRSSQMVIPLIGNG